MLKLIIAGRRAPGRTRRGAHDHLRRVHAPMVVCPPADAGAMPADYVQNHVVDGAYPGTGEHAIERDLVTELWFEDVDHLKSSTATPYYLAHLKPDEPRFVDDATVVKMMVRATPLVEGARGRFKAFLFLSGDDAAMAPRFAAAPGLTAATRNIVLSPPGAAPFVDTVLEGWFGAEEEAVAALEQIAGALPPGIDRTRSFAVAAREFDTAVLREELGRR